MQCPDCLSTEINKNGHKKGKQNLICVRFGRQFIEDYQPHRGYSKEVQREGLNMSMAWVLEPLAESKIFIILQLLIG